MKEAQKRKIYKHPNEGYTRLNRKGTKRKMYTKTERIEKIMRGESKATVLTQNEVAYLFAHGIDDKRSGTGNLHSQSDEGVLWHYRTIEAIRQKDGTVLKNRECYSAGFASCPTVPKAKHWLDLSTLHRFLHIEQIREIEILDEDKDGNNHLIGITEKSNLNITRYFLNGTDERQRYVAELTTPCKTVKEAFESMKPEIVKGAERHGLMVKRQGEIFFIPVSKAFGKLPITDILRPMKNPKTRYGCRKCGRKDVGSYNHYYVSSWDTNPCEGHKEDVEEYESFTVERPTIRIDQFEFRQHTATRTAIINGFTVVKGVIRHSWAQHRQLNLGDQWHIVAKNVVVRSISVGIGAD